MSSKLKCLVAFGAIAFYLAKCAILAQQLAPSATNPIVPLSDVPANVFITDHDSVFSGSGMGYVLRAEIQRALAAPESRPEEIDTVGN